MQIKMKAISRRRFLQVAGATILVAAVAAPAFGGGRNHKGPKKIRVRPLPSQRDLSSSQQSFFHRARFATAADAMRVTASRGLIAEIYEE